jgi:WD40 repeat protein
MTDERLKELLRDAPLPDEDEVRERSWRVVQAAYEQHPAGRPLRRRNRRLGLALAGAVAVLAIALTPAGAKVVEAFRDVTGIGKEDAKPALTSLPAPGSLVVESPVGPWVVRDDGSKRHLGDYRQATWSPHGLYLAVAGGRQLAAVTPEGDVRWALSHRSIRDPRWSPSGVRVAYRAGSSLRVAAGDASSDLVLDGSVLPVAPAWRPLRQPSDQPITTGPGTNVLAYFDADHRIVVIDTQTGRVKWRSAPRSVPFELDWSSDGKQLLAVSRRRLDTYQGPSRYPTSAGYNSHQSIRDAAYLPGTHEVAATIRSRSGDRVRSAVQFGRPDIEAFLHRRLFAGPGHLTDLAWSPNGEWLLVAWPDADQWLFIRPADGKVRAVDHISHQFDPGASGPVAFPRIDGWCCAP